ncbi:MAG: hypothetical protein N4R24_04395 [Lactobacillus iners]|uniref:Uncharacterized protein n=1 Tax=Lactobacillus iners TaxID=147802 RepID=A0A6G7B8G4_9LACO|nr:hypothetical protein [Lactobacillus iners]DAY42773.1 MAG TPA: hypothetical protein [Caudoviricetes sp.]MCT7695994.1 hypothetical protein [Lactobacillus iners]MCT7801212.1 hypothetical protein [Lactobacillus iners]MCT7845573.1 hypothetical protein [Lactobacillus iners]QIH23576.1 hypothetical protein G6Z83_02330 [Lactobacillus iners]
MLIKINQTINRLCDCNLSVKATALITLAYAVLIIGALIELSFLGAPLGN